MQIPKNSKKLKRFLENEYYAQDARFWMGAAKTADRSREVLYPINKQAFKGTVNRPIDKGKKKKENIPVIVYALRFDDILGRVQSFIKIGITKQSIEARFFADAERYTITLIKQRILKSRKYALTLENALHVLLNSNKFRPEKILLSGGNSECFLYSDELKDKISDLLD